MNEILNTIDEQIGYKKLARDAETDKKMKYARHCEMRGMRELKKTISGEIYRLEELKDILFDELLCLSEPDKFPEAEYNSDLERLAQTDVLRTVIIKAGLFDDFNEFYEECINVWEAAHGKDD